MSNANLIKSDYISIANVFIFVAFVYKQIGLLYIIVYHYKLNAILALPIANFTDKTTLTAYKQQFELLNCGDTQFD
jgi:hypothetical protein